ncbi:NUDIX hydrolase [Mycetohabitans sp. B2]|uniref:NUDIX hydrolase n=2 Tax=Burkholderiaceae TaxID=119060 RepID=A0ABZ2PTP2_9BURK|nr:NUDIX hydrolase [Mycetohabitans sp. B2]
MHRSRTRTRNWIVMPKQTSCGVVILNELGSVLLCHATETRHWDIPKGQPNPGEAPIDAALRETREETGLTLDAAALVELGAFSYRSDKELHLFATRVSTCDVDIRECVCTCLFPSYRNGKMIPEMDAFRWVQPTEVSRYTSASLTRLFETKLSLPALHRQLSGAAT